MIGHLTGTPLHTAPDRVVVDVAGVGYELRIPLSTFYAVARGGKNPVSLHVHTHVREDALELFGFATGDERAAFVQLIGISGVGPRMALAILSGIGVAELRETVWRRDRTRLQKIPGVGKKTAERLLLELRDRMGLKDLPDPAVGDGPVPEAAVDAPSLRSDAGSALVNLGYSAPIADRAVARALETGGEDPTLESVLRSALAGLVR